MGNNFVINFLSGKTGCGFKWCIGNAVVQKENCDPYDIKVQLFGAMYVFIVWSVFKQDLSLIHISSNLTFKGNCETTKSVFGNVYVEQRDNEKLSFFDCINGKHICSLYVEGKHLVAFGYDKLVLKDAYGDIEVWNLGELTGSKIPALANYKTSEPTIFALTKNAQLKLLEQKKIN